jgi:hypothetical protein
MKSPKKKPTAAKLQSWRVATMRSRAHGLGTVQAPDQKTAENRSGEGVALSEDQRKRLLILWSGLTGKNRIMIHDPKDDGTYVVEFRTADGDALAISIPRTEAHVMSIFSTSRSEWSA